LKNLEKEYNMIDVSKIAEKVMGKLQANSQENYSKDILKLEIGSVVTGRFLLNINDPENTIWPYAWHGWTSTNGSGKKIFFLCPSTYGETCPVCQKSIKMWKQGSEAEKEISRKISRRRNRAVNFYIINDNKNAENNGTVKIFRYGEQIDTILKEATIGDNKDVYGDRIWKLDETGCNFRIKATANSDRKDAWPTYVTSSFLPPSKIDGMTPELAEKIYNSCFDLTKQYEVKTYKEIADILEEHFTVYSESGRVTVPETPQAPREVPIPQYTQYKDAEPPKPIPPAPTEAPKVEVAASDDEIDNILKEINGK